MSTMSELHARLHVDPVDDEVMLINAYADVPDVIAELEYKNRQYMEEHPEAVNPVDKQPIWLLNLRGRAADFFHWLAYKVDYCPF